MANTQGKRLMSEASAPSKRQEDLSSSPGPESQPWAVQAGEPHRGVVMTGENGEDGPKAFYINIEAKPGREEDVVLMLRDIYGCVLDEPATGPWFGVRYSATNFGIFEAFPSIAGRDKHVVGGGGDIFRDNDRMNEILAHPARVYRIDVLMAKRTFAG